MSDEFVNKVAESGLITIDLEEYYPKEPIAIFDMKEHLFMGFIIKEKEFREALKNLDLSIYQNKNSNHERKFVVFCFADVLMFKLLW